MAYPEEYTDTRTTWQFIREHWDSVIIGALIGAFLFFPGFNMIFTALAVVSEAMK